ncbi:MFS transporter [Deinococcus hohokamensis]|uniref:MFS transporter n=1 Tax=Deinococcus hohokamensis TaxID=309883 RepID=A0ABV9IEX6_9DEIO
MTTTPASPPRPPLAFLLTTAFLFSIGMTLVFPVLPFIVLQYVPGAAQQAGVLGALGACFALLSFFSAPVMGALSDAYGRRPVLMLSLLGSAVGYVLFGVGGSLWMLFLGRGIDGLTAGGMSALFGYLADTVPEEERGKVFGQVGATVGAGFIVGPALGGALSHLSLSAPMFAAAAVCLLNLLWGAFILPESLRPEQRQRHFDAAHLNPLRQLRGALALPAVRRLVTVSVLFMLPFAIMQTVLALLGRDALHWGPAQMGTAFMVVGVCDIVAQGGLLPWLLRHLGEPGVARLGLALGVLGAAGLAALALWPTPALLYGAVILMGVGEGIFTASMGALLSNAAPADAQGRVQGGAQSFSSLAQVAGPLAAGQLYARTGGGGTFGLSAALILLALGVLVTGRAPQPQGTPDPA